jgi:hypothetical protein
MVAQKRFGPTKQVAGTTKSRTLATTQDTRKRGVHTPVTTGPLAPTGGNAPPDGSGPGGD